MNNKRLARYAGLLLAPILVTGASVTAASAANGARASLGDFGSGGRTLYVNNALTTAGAGGSCATAAYLTIGAAITAASAGDTIIVCPGTYTEEVIVDKSLVLHGLAGAIITVPATTPTQPAVVNVTASDVHISGFTINGGLSTAPPGLECVHAGGGIYDVDVEHNTLISCGEELLQSGGAGLRIPTITVPGLPTVKTSANHTAIHYQGVAYSRIEDNHITGSLGAAIVLEDTNHIVVDDNEISENDGEGVVITDGIAGMLGGPAYDNVVADNHIWGNFDSGVLLVGLNTDALSSTGVHQYNLGGVFDNELVNNRVQLNDGVGVGVLADGINTAAFDNEIEHNTISGNEGPGVLVASETTLAAGEHVDLDGNEIVSDDIGGNGAAGIVVYSPTESVFVTIAHNFIHFEPIGIFLSRTVFARGLFLNAFSNVGQRVVIS